MSASCPTRLGEYPSSAHTARASEPRSFRQGRGMCLALVRREIARIERRWSDESCGPRGRRLSAWSLGKSYALLERPAWGQSDVYLALSRCLWKSHWVSQRASSRRQLCERTTWSLYWPHVSARSFPTLKSCVEPEKLG